MPGKEFTSFDTAAVARELKTQTTISLVSNIYQLDAKTVLLKLHKTDQPPIWLVLEAGRRANLTAYASDKPSTPPAFCMALRKYLRHAKLLDVRQHEFERVLVLTFKGEEGNLNLILEIFGEGNIILVGENNQILQALTYKKMRDRNIIRGETFKFAPSTGTNPSKTDEQQFSQTLRSIGQVEAVRGLARSFGIGGVYAEETLLRANVEKTTPCADLSEHELGRVYSSLNSMISQVFNRILEPCIVQDESGTLVDATPLRLMRYGSEAYNVRSLASFDEALDEFYSKTSVVEHAAEDAEVAKLNAEVKRIGRIVADQKNVVANARTQAEHYKHLGDLVYANFSDLETVLEKFLQESKGGKDVDELVSSALVEKQRGTSPWTFFESFDRKEFAVSFCVEGSRFNLSLRKTLLESAAGFYDQGKRFRQKMEGAQAALNDSLRKLEDVQLRIDRHRLEAAAKPEEAIEELEKRKIKHKEWFEKFRSFESSDGFLVVGGRDAVTNEVLMKKHTEPDDVVLHADITGAPFVVIKTVKKKPSEQCLHEAGEFAAAFSRAWREGFASVDVYWVKPEQLSKGGPSGESVAHGAFVVRGERNWMRGTPLKIAVGVQLEENGGSPRICGGPVDAVKSKTGVYEVIVPGDLEGRELFKRVLKSLGEKVPRDRRDSVIKLPLELMREFIPFSKGTIAKT